MSRSTVKSGPKGRTSPTAGSPTPAADVPGHDQRDGQGRFTAGNAGGPGNPFARQVAALRSALIEAVTPDDVRAIALELLTQAKCGHLAAIKLLFSYVLGKPTVAPNPDAVDLDEWQLRRQAPTAAEAQETLFERRSPGLVNAAARGLAVAQHQEVLDLARADESAAPVAASASPPVRHEPVARLGAPSGATGLVTKPSFTDGVNELAALLRLVTAPPPVPAGEGPPAPEEGWLIDEVNESLRRERRGERH